MLRNQRDEIGDRCAKFADELTGFGNRHTAELIVKFTATVIG
jgi:hypothetical protein